MSDTNDTDLVEACLMLDAEGIQAAAAAGWGINRRYDQDMTPWSMVLRGNDEDLDQQLDCFRALLGGGLSLAGGGNTQKGEPLLARLQDFPEIFSHALIGARGAEIVARKLEKMAGNPYLDQAWWQARLSEYGAKQLSKRTAPTASRPRKARL